MKRARAGAMWVAIASVAVWSWQAACVLAGLRLALSLCGLLVEMSRRRTLIGIVEKAPQGTTVVMNQASGLPAVRVHVGSGPVGRAPTELP